MRLLENKICLITGASRGIGYETARKFAEEGAVVYVNSRTAGSLDSVCKEWSSEYDTEVKPVYFDVTDSKSVLDSIKQIKKGHGHLDVLVNNAGIMKDALVGMINLQLMEEVFSVNVFSVLNMIQSATRIMGGKNPGSIINISSVVATQGAAGQTVYSASKGAVISLTKSAAKELAPKNIRVNAVAPGMVDTDMFRQFSEKKDINTFLSNIKFGRLGSAVEIANSILFLASDLSSYMTGQVLGVDGGTYLN